jgi:hypothetical protein
VTITFFGGFFKKIYDGKEGIVTNNREQKPYFGENTSLQERAFTIIHEGIHAIDRTFSDGFIGRVIKNLNRKEGDKKVEKDLSREDGSKAINNYIKDHCSGL